MEKKILEGIKVLELATFVAGPVCARMLGDFGAEVIKVEALVGDGWRPTGWSCGVGKWEDHDYENPVFDIYNSGKKSITLNLKTPEGLSVMDKLISECDIFLTNTRVQSLARLGLDPETIRKKYPKVIYSLITAYGTTGPDANSPGYDSVAFWTRTGFIGDTIVDVEGGYPIDTPASFGDTVAGTNLLAGILAAIIRRDKTGEGDFVTTSLYGTGIWVMGTMILRAQKRYGEHFPKKRYECKPLAQPYLCADGRWVKVMLTYFIKKSGEFYDMIGHPELKQDPRFTTYDSIMKNKAEATKIFEEAFLKRPSYEWLAMAKKIDFPCDLVAHYGEVPDCPQARANEYIQDYVCPNGAEGIMPCNAIRIESQGVYHTERGPYLGEHNVQILKELGYSDEDIQNMRNNKAITEEKKSK